MRFLLLLLISSAALGQTVSKARAVGAEPPASVDVKIADGERQLSGTLSISAESIRFCCKSIVEPDTKAAAKCPYSFTVPAAQIKEQYLATEEAGQKWHVVTADKEDFTFSATASALSTGFEAVKKSVPSVVSEKLEKLAGPVKAGVKLAAIPAGDECK
jgi:hypothetical protein